MSALLEVKDVSLHFPIFGGVLKRQVGSVFAVSDVNLTLRKGETLGIVGESGCGKTTLGRTIVQLYQATSGSIYFKGQRIDNLGKGELKGLRQSLQMIFQDPYASLNPRMTIKDILIEPLNLHQVGTKDEREEKVVELVKLVGLRAEDIFKFPHEFSGGQRQRIGIARSLMLEPDLIIADEPVSALDVSIQSQVINLLVKLQEKFDLTYIFISHDLTVVKYISDRVAVMYLGRVVELADSDDIYRQPAHPYTQALLSSVPLGDPRKKISGEVLEGDVPSPSNPPPGCPFHQRCKYVEEVCRREVPKLEEMRGRQNHAVACHLNGRINEGRVV